MAPTHPLLRLPPRDDDGNLHVVIETPRGSVHKLAFDPERELFVLKKAMPAGMAFPFDFGFVPGTRAGDGDPLDVLVLLDGATPPGVLVEARLVGAIEAEQRNEEGETERNDRLVAVGLKSRTFGRVRALSQLPRDLVDDVERFFVVYAEALGKPLTPIGRAAAQRANTLVDAASTRPASGRRPKKG
jgi:inorganic pyrophosphatase